MSITNTTKESLKDEHIKHHQRKLFFGVVCYAHLFSFLWWCLLCSSFKFSLVVFVMLIFLVFFGGVCYAHLLSFLGGVCYEDEHGKHHQRKLKR
jgi:ABC-type multidrug transport system permease subunit